MRLYVWLFIVLVRDFQISGRKRVCVCAFLYTCIIHIVYKMMSRLMKWLSLQSLSRVWLFVTPRTASLQASPSITISWNLLKLMPFESVMPSNHLILCRPLLLLPSTFPSIRVFSNESEMIREAVKSQDLLSVIWRPRKITGVIQFKFSVLRTREISAQGQEKKRWNVLTPSVRQEKRLNSSFLCLFFQAFNWLDDTHPHREGKSTMVSVQILISSINILTDT